jgi:hypothetical protein
MISFGIFAGFFSYKENDHLIYKIIIRAKIQTISITGFIDHMCFQFSSIHKL